MVKKTCVRKEARKECLGSPSWETLTVRVKQIYLTESNGKVFATVEKRKLGRVNLRKDFWDKEKWPIADRRVLSSGPRNHCGTHFGSSLLVVSKVTNSCLCLCWCFSLMANHSFESQIDINNFTTYSHFFLSRTPLGPVLSVHLREMSVF